MNITRSIIETRKISYDIEEFVLEPYPRQLAFRVTGIQVFKRLDRGDDENNSRQPVINLTGEAIKRDGTPAGGTRATTAVGVQLGEDFRGEEDGGYEFRYHYTTENLPKVFEAANAALEAFNQVVWEDQ